MIKRIGFFVVLILVMFASLFLLNQYFIDQNDANVNLPLLGMYIFHASSSIIIYLIVEAVFSKLPNQTGFAYLASVFLKIGFFILLFASNVFSDSPLNMAEKLSIVAPFFTFLLVEAAFSFKLLNNA